MIAIRDLMTLFRYVAHAAFINWPPHAKRLIVAMALTDESIPALHRIAGFVITDLLSISHERALTADEAHLQTIAHRFRASCEYVARTRGIDLYSDKRGDRAAARRALDDLYERALWQLNQSSSETIQ